MFCNRRLLKAEGNTLPFKVTVIGPKDQPMFRPRIVDKEVTGEEYRLSFRGPVLSRAFQLPSAPFRAPARPVTTVTTGRTFVEEHEVQWRDARSPSPLQAPVSFLVSLCLLSCLPLG